MNIIANFISELNRDKMLRRKTIRIIVVLSLIITAFVFWQLRVIGIAMTDEACCGLTEHVHDEGCASERELICELEESETSVYSCGYEDGDEISIHTHDGECFDGDELICELPETLTHYHTESCAGTSAHTHTDECYQIIYNCGIEPHVHTLECYSDPNADVETAADWEKTIPELKDDWAVDLVSVAESQIGYAESSKNVEIDVLEDESLTRHGYTRYGAWYGEDREQPFRYIDNWSAVFASFCLHYAGIPEEDAPQNLGCGTMMQDWQKIERFGASDDCSPACGDLVFLDKDGNGIADSVGIISDIDDDGFKAIEGSSNDCVEKNTYSFDDEAILGYGMLPEMSAEEIVDKELPVEGPEEELVEEFTAEGSDMPAFALFGVSPETQLFDAGVPGDLEGYITDIDYSGTIVYDATHYYTLLKMYFDIPTADFATTRTFTYALPEGISLTDGLVNGGPYEAKMDSDTSVTAFTYEFIDDGDGTYSIGIVFDSNYIASASANNGGIINDWLSFRAFIDRDSDSDSNGIVIEFSDDCSLVIPPSDIYADYDITTAKTGVFDINTGKLSYEATVSSVLGTPGEIQITDIIQQTGDMPLSNPRVVSVVKHLANGGTETISDTNAQFTPAFDGKQYTLTMDLPQLGGGESYTIKYEYSLNGFVAETNELGATNSVTATSSGHDSTVTDTSYWTLSKPRNFYKYGTQTGKYVTWTITVNESKSNIANKTLWDDEFANAVNEDVNGVTGIRVIRDWWPDAVEGTDYELVYSGGKVTGIKFLPTSGGQNNTCYHIQYNTPFSADNISYDSSGYVFNTAKFDNKETTGAAYVVGSLEKAQNGYTENADGTINTNWTISVNIPCGGIKAGTVFTDTLSPEGHYLTDAQWNAVKTALQNAWGSGNITAINPTYTNERITGYTFIIAGSEGTYKLQNDGMKTVSWSYSATGAIEGDSYKCYVNTISDGKNIVFDQIKINPSVKKLNVQYKNWNYAFSEADKYLELDYDNLFEYDSPYDISDTTYMDRLFNSLVWCVEIDPIDNLGTTEYNIMDTLPKGVVLRGIKVTHQSNSWWYGYDQGTEFNATIDDDGNISGILPSYNTIPLNKTNLSGTVTTNGTGQQVISLKIAPPTDGSASTIMSSKPFRVFFYCDLADDMWPTNGTVQYSLKNTVTVGTGDSFDNYGDTDNTIVVDASRTFKRVDKGASWNSDSGQIDYTVDINPQAENLIVSENSDPDKLSFTDILTYTAKQGTSTTEAVLDLNSVLLEKEVDGEWVTVPNVNWSAHTEIDETDANIRHAHIDMEVPDSTHLRLSYSYKVTSSMTSNISIKNSAAIAGVVSDSDDTNTDIESSDFEHGGGSDFAKAKEYQLYKISSSNGKALEGAVFTAYRWDASANDWVSTGKTYTTDSDGKFNVTINDEISGGQRVYSVNTAYCLRETSAPNGFVIPEFQPNFYFWFSSNKAAPDNKPSDFMMSAADISTASARVVAENDSAPVTLPETGGIGAVPFILAGLLLMAGVMLKTSKRRKAAKAR